MGYPGVSSVFVYVFKFSIVNLYFSVEDNEDNGVDQLVCAGLWYF